MSSSLERYEALGALYYRTSGHLRPGKYEAPETGRSSMDPENVERFETWLASRAFTEAIDRIVELEGAHDAGYKQAIADVRAFARRSNADQVAGEALDAWDVVWP